MYLPTEVGGKFGHETKFAQNYIFLFYCRVQSCNLCVSLGESKNRFVISDHSDYGASKEPTNPCLEWIRRFL